MPIFRQEARGLPTIVLSRENLATEESRFQLLGRTDLKGLFSEYCLVNHKGVSYILRSRAACLYMVREAMLFYTEGDSIQTAHYRQLALQAEEQTELILKLMPMLKNI